MKNGIRIFLVLCLFAGLIYLAISAITPSDNTDSNTAEPVSSSTSATVDSGYTSAADDADDADDEQVATLQALNDLIGRVTALAEENGWNEDAVTADELSSAQSTADALAKNSSATEEALAMLEKLQNETLPRVSEPCGPVMTVVDGVTYFDGVLVVNKTYTVPAEYGDGITPEAQAAFDTMQAAAAAEGLSLNIVSGFRSYDYQAGIYNKYVARDGQQAADTYSARPGHSEHQTGLAMDINSTDVSMADTPEGIWLAQHCAEYGFILRYPQGKEEITGYQYEPWHIRFLGSELAKTLTAQGLTLEEYFGITSQYSEDSNA